MIQITQFPTTLYCSTFYIACDLAPNISQCFQYVYLTEMKTVALKKLFKGKSAAFV